MNKTKIEWTDKTWNPITGCSQISEGCKNCYAKKMAKRLQAMGNPRYVNNFEITIHRDLFNKPLMDKTPSVIFVCSMSDLFHEDVPFDAIAEIFDTMEKATQHVFQVLTKRPHRMREFLLNRKVPKHIWIGTSVELDQYQNRIDDLTAIDAHVKFLSCEPLLGSLRNCNFDNIQWVVVGGESGSNSRPVSKDWIIEIRDICEDKKIDFFFKQWGGWNKKKNGHDLDGKTYKQMPKFK